MKLISFAYDFVSYMLQNLDQRIERIFLFGSVVRGEASNKSDIDLFVECNENLQKKIDKIVDKFYESSKYKNYWKLLNVRNQIKPIVGKLEDFPGLKRSIIGNGIVLYSGFNEKVKGKNYSLFIVEFKGEFKMKMQLWRKLYGRMQIKNKKEYFTKGIIENNGGKKLTRGVFIVPIEKGSLVIKELEKLKIGYKVYDISSDNL